MGRFPNGKERCKKTIHLCWNWIIIFIISTKRMESKYSCIFITTEHMLDAWCAPLGDFIFKPSPLYLPGAVPFFLLYLLRNYSLLTEARHPKGNIQNTKNCTKRSKTLDSEITNKRQYQTHLPLSVWILSATKNPTQILIRLANMWLFQSLWSCSSYSLQHPLLWFSCGWPTSSCRRQLQYHIIKETSLYRMSFLSIPNTFLQNI